MDKDEMKLLKRIKLRLEEYGMPEFKDDYPAMDILQLIKDTGYCRPSPSIRVLDRKKLVSMAESIYYIDAGRFTLEFHAFLDAICKELGTGQVEISEAEIVKVLNDEHYHPVNVVLGKAVCEYLKSKGVLVK